MATQYEVRLLRVHTTDEVDGFSDVVRKVEWEVHFYDDQYTEKLDDGTYKYKTQGAARTVLPIDSLNSDTFINYSDLTQRKICEWAFDTEGGNTFINSILNTAHAAELNNIITIDRLLTEKTVADITKE
tara:strand:+ start:2945 stop:3331 length:387 start_codon:yes stop_codon:yes gene_type:complete